MVGTYNTSSKSGGKSRFIGDKSKGCTPYRRLFPRNPEGYARLYLQRKTTGEIRSVFR
jgi:hypothetical protein